MDDDWEKAGVSGQKRRRIRAAIARERLYQDSKWGTTEEHPHTVAEWLLIMQAELDEAKQGWLKGRGDDEALLELLQAISVGVACLEQHGICERGRHRQYWDDFR